MTQQGVRWTAEQVLALAPDDASRKAGSRLGAAGPWSRRAVPARGRCGDCARAAAASRIRRSWTPHGPGVQVQLSEPEVPVQARAGAAAALGRGRGRRCRGAGAGLGRGVAGGRGARARPEQTARRARAGPRAGGPGGGAAPGGAPGRHGSPRAPRSWSSGWPTCCAAASPRPEQAGYGLWEETAARMVDAQAPGLAARVRELGAIPGSRPRLAGPAAGGVRAAPPPGPGLAGRRSAAGAAGGDGAHPGRPARAPRTAPPVRDHWLVLAQYDTSDGRLTTRRIWLHGRRVGPYGPAALLRSGRPRPAAGAAGGPDVRGGGAPPTRAAGQLRADLGERFARPGPDRRTPPPGRAPVHAAVEAYGAGAAGRPLAGLLAGDADPGHTRPGRRRLATGRRGRRRRRCPSPPPPAPAPACGGSSRSPAGGPVTVFGECGHRGFTPLTAWPEAPAETVPLT